MIVADTNDHGAGADFEADNKMASTIPSTRRRAGAPAWKDVKARQLGADPVDPKTVLIPILSCHIPEAGYDFTVENKVLL